jgi:ATP-dependent Lhr-like helicase
VLVAFEERGRARRGYFIAGLGGSQFADPGALERLRELRDGGADAPAAQVLAATDPANPFGQSLPWPGEGRRTSRSAGAHVVLVDGRLTAYLTREQRELHGFLPDEDPLRSRLGRACARALHEWARRTGRLRLGWRPGDSAGLGALRAHLLEAGFVPSGPGVRLG